ncbi:glycosyl hydrolase [Streptomyces sp. NBC_00138]|uniref:glycosyl hydrolase n=1 Tax=Streptomyces sp. NBC_00138 TaxID=2903625 RepID=UPI003245AB38
MASHARRTAHAVHLLLAGALLASAVVAAGPGRAHADTAPPPASGATVYQAEDGTLHGVVVATDEPGYQGTGYVEGFDDGADSVTISVPNSPGGLFALSVRYRSPFGEKKASLLVNGSGIGEVDLPGTDSGFADAQAGKVLLTAGANTVTVQSDWGWYGIDSISLAPVPPRAPHAVTGALTDPRATPQARSLMSYLTSQYGRNLLSGQQDSASEQAVEGITGRAPAIEGLDLMDYSPSRVERGTNSQEIENALAWNARGGIVSLVWHWNAPTDLIDQPGKEWWRGFYTDATTFDVAAALADPTSADYQLLLRDIDAIAVQLGRLQDAGVPVLWRPLHEAEGGWFWWGAKGAGPAKALYRLMYDRLTNVHHLHNLIWVWNSVDPAWYPGDDVVDIVSADSYPAAGDHGPVALTYDRLLSLGNDTKPAALAEVGSVPDPELTRAYQADWSYFVTWSGDYVTDGTSNSAGFLRRVYNDDQVITLDELGDFTHDGGCRADFQVLSRWSGNYLAQVTVHNTGSKPIRNWQVGWRLRPGSDVTQSWNASFATTGGSVRATAESWNGTLDPGATAVFGYLGTDPGSGSALPAPSCSAA